MASFDPLAAQYARGRPRYPAELFAWLASLVPGHELAWDCGTGNGQAALGLAQHFAHVVATDVSAEQLRHAGHHPHVRYLLAPVERSGLNPGSVDLVTAASAAHWFDLRAFAAEVARVTRPGSVLAVWTYAPGNVLPPFHDVFRRFWGRMRPWFGGGDLVDDGYRSLVLPGHPVEAPAFEVRADWSEEQVLAYVRSWNAFHVYCRETGDDPLPALASELTPIFGQERALPFRMPLHLRVQRL